MQFKEVVQVFAQIEQTSSRNQMTILFAQLLQKASAQEAGVICNIALGELYPPYQESMFNIAQKTLIPVVASVLAVPAESIEKEVKKVGDLGEVIAKGSWQKEPESISTIDLYHALVSLEKITGIGSQKQRAERIKMLLKLVDPLSAKYIVRMILGKLRLGFSDMTILDALSWMFEGDKSLKPVLEKAYNICADIGLIATMLKQKGLESIKRMPITIGIPIRPAAAERLPTAQAIFEKIGPCIAQPKLDGFRLQIHIDKRNKKSPKILFFSRNLKNMSAMFPDLMRHLQDLDVTTMICEGEAMGYDQNSHTFLPFQKTVKRKRKHGIHKASQEFPLKLFLFDIVYLNDVALFDVPCQERYLLLKKIVSAHKDGLLTFIEEKYIDSVQALDAYFKQVIAEGLEGLVVKRLDGGYQPGKRNFNWIKLKRSAQEGVEDTIDAVILGYYGGAGRRAEFGIGAILVGVYNKEEDCFETIAKVGTGFSDKEWIELKQRCDALQISYQPHNVVCVKGLYPDVWVLPQIVCEIFADEITKSPLHTTGKQNAENGLALRFPRFMRYREDKFPEDATTVQEIKDMYEHQTRN